jgi:hypothetical protein
MESSIKVHSKLAPILGLVSTLPSASYSSFTIIANTHSGPSIHLTVIPSIHVWQ